MRKDKKKKTRGNEVDSIIKQNNRRAKVGNSHGKPNKISKNGTNSPRHAAVCHGVTREEEDGSSGACVLGAGGYCGNIFVWDFGRLLVATPEVMHQWDTCSIKQRNHGRHFFVVWEVIHRKKRENCDVTQSLQLSTTSLCEFLVIFLLLVRLK